MHMAKPLAAEAPTGAPWPLPCPPGSAAFFDVDNTVVRGATIFHLARGLYRRHFLDTSDLLRMTQREAAYLLRGEDETHIAEARTAGLEFIAGREVSELADLSEQVYEETIANKLWPGVVERMHEHLEQDDQVWLVTATPIELASVIARELGITGALGTVAETVDGVYTGRLQGGILHGERKAEAVRTLAAQRGLSLADCAAYSDSANDLPLLNLVGHPSAVNPDAGLRRVAKESEWPILDFQRSRRLRTAKQFAGVTAAVGAAVAAKKIGSNAGRPGD